MNFPFLGTSDKENHTNHQHKNYHEGHGNSWDCVWRWPMSGLWGISRLKEWREEQESAKETKKKHTGSQIDSVFNSIWRRQRLNPFTARMVSAILKSVGHRLPVPQTSGFQWVVPRIAVWTSPGNLWEMQSLRPHLRHITWENLGLELSSSLISPPGDFDAYWSLEKVV